MILFKIIYLLLALVMTFVVIRALVSNWQNYAKSQRAYMIGFTIILAGLAQGAAAMVHGTLPFTYRTAITLTGLVVMGWGTTFGRDPRLQERTWAQAHPEEFEKYLRILQESRKAEQESQ